MKPPRSPNQLDYLVFYVAIPVLFGIWATPYVIPPKDIMDFGIVPIYLYVCFRALTAWVFIDLACRCVGHSLSRFKLPLWLIFLIGFTLSTVPIVLFGYVTIEVTRLRNPDIAPFIGHESLGWNVDYFMAVAKYAVPGLVVWFGAAYGYMKVFNVALFSYAAETAKGMDEEPVTSSEGEAAPPLSPAAQQNHIPSFMLESRLAPDSSVIAIKAEEHYIRVWSDSGTDLLRHRFKDAVHEMQDAGGLQVHRSWWVRLSSVSEFRMKGRKMELYIEAQDLTVPVSLSYKQALLHALEQQGSLPSGNPGLLFSTGDQPGPKVDHGLR